MAYISEMRQGRIVVTQVTYKPKISYYSSKYGTAWVKLSQDLRLKQGRKCQWCCKKFRNTSDIQGHHIGCMKYNFSFLLDERIILLVCDSCHKILEPYSRIKLEQMLPQLFEA